MKHTFHICQNVSESLGLEKILNFYNLIVLEHTDGVEDFENTGQNVFLADNFTSPEFQKYIKDYSYEESPLILSSIQSATVKISQLYDWEIKGVKPGDSVFPSNEGKIVFSVYKKGDKKIFGNIHKYFSKDSDKFSIEVMDWSNDYISEVTRIVDELQNLEEGYSTVECTLLDGNKLILKNSFPEALPSGIGMFTRAQILDNKSPFVLHEIFDDIEKEDPLSFVEGFKPQNPISQDKPYNITAINIKSKYESIIKNDFAGGVWKYGGDNTGKTEKICLVIYQIDEEGDKTLCLLHRGFSLYDVEGQEGIVINTREKGKSLTAGDNFATLRIPTNILDSRGEIVGWVFEVINAITHIQTQ